MMMSFLGGTYTPNTAHISFRIGLHESIWNKVTFVHHHNFIDLTIFLLIKNVMNLFFVVVSKIVCHILQYLKHYKSLPIHMNCINLINHNLKMHSKNIEEYKIMSCYWKSQNAKKRTIF